ncbi:MAG: sigma-54-dependent transcriptional regulator [Thermodesulfobacteriota bacterium]
MKIPPIARTLLVIDDDRILCDTLAGYLQGENLEVLSAHTGLEGLRIASQRKVDVILLDQKLPDGEGHLLCSSLLQYHEQTKIIFITAYPSFDRAVAAIKAGAYDYLSKPFELEELRLAVERALRTLELEEEEQLQNYYNQKESEGTVLIGSCGAMKQVQHLVKLAASSMAPVLITGETGTGKNVVARVIHYHSLARRPTFISINCAALPENLIEAELFGYEKGAFTGAVSSRKGVFEMAEGGTLFLDEIGSMPWSLQSKLLSALEDKQIKRLGGESLRQVNVRIIAATNTDLEKSIKEKNFREDLYYRLNIIRIHLPPLRERREDIPSLCHHFLRLIAGGRTFEIPEAEMAKLMDYPWPGNVRELKNILERAVLLQKGPILRPAQLLKATTDFPVVQDERFMGFLPQALLEVEKSLVPLEEVERNYILHALDRLGGNYTRTAKALGISLSTLKRKMKKYGVA